MNRDGQRPWFPAKRYGWGWGVPCTWQGWLVLLAFVVVIAVGAVLLLPGNKPLPFIAWCIGAAAALVAICWWKGERPRWRWGGE